MSKVIVDDGLLLRVLAGAKPSGSSSAIVATGCWYYRLARAIHSPAIVGRLSGAVQALEPPQLQVLLQSLDSLPSGIELVSWQHLVPVMRQLDGSHRLNLLAAEAIATALVLDAPIRVETDNPSIARASATLGIDYERTLGDDERSGG